eukprot:scaffold22.g6158.t1
MAFARAGKACEGALIAGHGAAECVRGSGRRRVASGHGRASAAMEDDGAPSGVPLGGPGGSKGDKYAGYDRAIGLEEEEEEEQDERERAVASKLASYTAPKAVLGDVPVDDGGDEGGSFMQSRRIVDRESEYSKRRLDRIISPDRNDAFQMGDKTPDARVRTYADVMREAQLARERDNTMRNIAEKKRREEEEAAAAELDARPTKASGVAAAAPGGKRSRWDSAVPVDSKRPRVEGGAAAACSEWDAVEATPAASRWDATPGQAPTATPGRWDKAPGGEGGTRASRWDATPAPGSGAAPAETPAAGGKRSRWDATPAMAAAGAGATPAYGAASLGATPLYGATPAGGFGMETPNAAMLAAQAAAMGQVQMTPELYQQMKPLSDEELDAMLPGQAEGYKVLPAPPGYVPITTPARKLMATPTPFGATPLYQIPEEDRGQAYDVPVALEGLPEMKPEDQQYFGKLLKDVDESELSVDEAKERKIMKLLLKVKNGTPPQRKSALRQLTDKARDFGAGPLFNQILPLLMSPTLEDQERHLLVKVIDRVLFRLDELVRPYVHKILVVIEPLLIDEDYYARVEGREIIANLAKAAGLATMIAAMRPDIDNVDEYVRNTTARAFSVVASALGIPALLPFLKAVCQSKKSWQARHTGIKIVQQIAILMGCAVLPHLKALVDIVKHGVVKQCVATDGVEPDYIRTEAGCAEIVGRVVEDLKDESEPYRKMVMETCDKVIKALGAADIDARLEELLVDGILYAYQEQVADESPVVLNGFGTIINALGQRSKPYLPQICGTIKWRLNNKSAKIRQQAADLISRRGGAPIAPVMKKCDEEKLLAHLGVVLYENLGEEYPEVLGSILGALKAIVQVIGMTRMTPPIKVSANPAERAEARRLEVILRAAKPAMLCFDASLQDLLPRLTPILKNRHEKVQENCIDLVGRIADRGAEYVPAREWMRICFELLDMLKGLFHPARRVREVYWRLYNNLYIGSQAALVAFYPRMDDDAINTYRRHELDVFI